LALYGSMKWREMPSPKTLLVQRLKTSEPFPGPPSAAYALRKPLTHSALTLAGIPERLAWKG